MKQEAMMNPVHLLLLLRYFFGMCAVTSKIGSVKLCAGCKVVGYIGKEEQVKES